MADPLRAFALDCGKRNEQPVILVKFGIAHPGLQGKLTARPLFEQQMSEFLAGHLRSEPGLRFLRWSANAADTPRKGVFQVLMTQDGSILNNEKVPILLKFQVIAEGQLREELSLGQAGVLYSAEDSQVPGQSGGAWKSNLIKRFSALAHDQPFANEMIRAFAFVPVVQTEDLLISQASKVIGLPVGPCRLSAGEGTQVDLEFRLRTEEGRRAKQAFWVNPCLLEAKNWQSRLQLATEEQADRIGQGKSQDWLDFYSQIGNRIPGRTRALLKSFNWKPEEVCGDIEMP
ncbi:MAG: hypothetical protein ABUT39_18185 [Acidobacteriota bacterium]